MTNAKLKEPTTNELLEQHNVLAKQIKAMKLKAWKGTKKDLIERIEGLKKQVKDETPEANKLMDKMVKDKIKKDDQISVVDVANDLGINAKVARAKLRRKGMKANEGRWPRFKRDSAEHKELIKLLKASDE